MPSLDTAHGGFFSRLVLRVLEYSDGSRRTVNGDYFGTEHLTGYKWVGGIPIYRFVSLITGGNNTSSTTIAELANHISVLNNARWGGRDGDFHRFMRGNNAGVDLEHSTGTVTVQHQTFDFTGEFIGVILEYTRLQDLP